MRGSRGTHLDELGILTTERDVVVKYFVVDRILEGSIVSDMISLPCTKPISRMRLRKAPRASHPHDDCLISCHVVALSSYKYKDTYFHLPALDRVPTLLALPPLYKYVRARGTKCARSSISFAYMEMRYSSSTRSVNVPEGSI